MKKFFGLLFFILIFSYCNKEKEKGKIMHIKSKLKNGLTLHKEFYPNSKNIYSSYFVDDDKNIIGISRLYYKNGKIKLEIDNKSNIRKCKTFYKNGNIESVFFIDKNNIRRGIEKDFYETGELKALYEYIVYQDSIQYTNTRRFFDKNGNVNMDSTFFYEIVTKTDTISLSDSLEVTFNVEKPNKSGLLAFRGSIDNYFGNKKWDKSLILKNKVYYFKPYKLGNNLIEIIFVTVYKNGTDSTFYTKTFLKKQVYVTE